MCGGAIGFKSSPSHHPHPASPAVRFSAQLPPPVQPQAAWQTLRGARQLVGVQGFARAQPPAVVLAALPVRLPTQALSASPAAGV